MGLLPFIGDVGVEVPFDSGKPFFIGNGAVNGIENSVIKSAALLCSFRAVSGADGTNPNEPPGAQINLTAWVITNGFSYYWTLLLPDGTTVSNQTGQIVNPDANFVVNSLAAERPSGQAVTGITITEGAKSFPAAPRIPTPSRSTRWTTLIPTPLSGRD